jgi:hypothetical protein
LAQAFSVVNIHLIRASTAFRCFSHAAIFTDETLWIVDSTVQALAAEHADLDLDHVEPTSVQVQL